MARFRDVDGWRAMQGARKTWVEQTWRWWLRAVIERPTDGRNYRITEEGWVS